MNVVKLAAFSQGNSGGNPAGVVLTDSLPTATQMREIAAEVGFSETVFAQMKTDERHWRIRYFSPESEVPFCGHATIALGAVLAKTHGEGEFQLQLNDKEIVVEGTQRDGQYLAAFQSPPTRHRALAEQETDEALTLFGYNKSQLSTAVSPAHIHGGADHLVFVLKSRADLAAMHYDLDQGRDFMNMRGIVTVMFVAAENERLFHARNAFASGGVYEDPATGAAAAAFCGYLRDIGCVSKGLIKIIQGEDMGVRSLITTELERNARDSVRVSGATRSLGLDN